MAPDVIGLGVDPLYRMLRSADPFDDCPVAAENLSPDCQEIRVVGTWAHQFYTYLELIESAYGDDVRSKVQQVILYSLNQHGDSGNQLESFLKLTHQAVASYGDDLARAGRRLGVTLATYLAVVLLTKVPDSPYFFGRSGECGGIPYGTVKTLSQCLERGANRVKRYYEAGLGLRMSVTETQPTVRRARLRTRLASWFGRRGSNNGGIVPRK